MKRTFAIALLAGLPAASPALAFASPRNGVDEILARMQAAAKTVHTLTAYLRQETQDLSIGGKPQTSSGRIIFSHGGRGNDKVRINYDKPAGQVICVAGDEIILYQPAINQETITRRRALASKNREFDFIATPYDSVSSLKARYDISYAGDEGQTAKLELKPKEQSSVKTLTLWVDRSSWLPIKYQVLEANNNLSTFSLTDLAMNRKLPSDAFIVRVAPGTKLVKP